MGRKSIYNNIVTPEKLDGVNKDNIDLGKDFIEYLRSVDRAEGTIRGYENDLKIFWVWVADNCKNKDFVDLSKRDISRFQSYAMNEWKWSPSRIRRVKSTLSSLSNFIENILDDEYKDFRPIIRKIENPQNYAVREKSIFTEQELKDLLDQLESEKKYDQACMLALAMCSGRRKAELPRMKVSYFNDSNIIFGSLYKTPEEVKTKGRGSHGKMLTLYVLKNGFKPYLEKWLKYREDNGITSEYLIPKCKGGAYLDEPVPISTLDSWAESFTKKLDKPFYWHSLRHYFTTQLSRSGLPDSVIKDIIGWSSLDMVSIYNDRSTDEEFAAYFDKDGIKQAPTSSLADL